MKYALSILPIVIAVAALVGWQWDISVLKRVSEGATAMNPLSAVCFILVGFEATRLLSGTANRVSKVVGLIAVSVVFVVCTLKLADVNLHTQFNIDRLLFAAKVASEHPVANRMAPNSALSFLCISVVALLMQLKSERAITTAQILTFIPICVALVAIVGYVYGVKELYTTAVFIPMAMNSACSFFLLSLTFWLACPRSGIAKVVLNDGPAGHMVALLLPASIMVPVLLGWLRIMGLRAKLFDNELGVALAVVSNAAVLFIVSFITARQLYLVDLRRKKAEDDLVHMAAHDALTQLLNRRVLTELVVRRMTIAERHKDHSYAMLYLDLDGFKKVNDTAGHAAGDQLLKSVSNILTSCVRAGDVVSRLGGDEFAILLEKIEKLDDVVAVAERILRTMPTTFDAAGEPIPIGISIGAALGTDEYSSCEDLFKAADGALYSAKAKGKGCYHFAACSS